MLSCGRAYESDADECELSFIAQQSQKGGYET